MGAAKLGGLAHCNSIRLANDDPAVLPGSPVGRHRRACFMVRANGDVLWDLLLEDGTLWIALTDEGKLGQSDLSCPASGSDPVRSRSLPSSWRARSRYSTSCLRHTESRTH